MPLRRNRGEFWGARRRTIDSCGVRFESLDATGSESDIVPHSHEESHFVWVFSGSYISGAKGAPHASAMPLLVYTPADVVHRDRFLNGEGSFVVLTIPTQLGANSGISVTGGEARVLRDLKGMCVGRQIADLVCDGSGDVEGLALTCLALLGDGERFERKRPPPWLVQAFELMMEEDGIRRVADVAAVIGVHPVHLARSFQQCLGISPGTLLRSRRMERVASDVATTRTTLAELSAGAGFTDQSHLSNQFRKTFGVSPLRWRRRHVSFLQDR